MDERISDMEQDMATVKIDVAVMRSNYVTKEDVAGIKADQASIHANYVTKDDLAGVKTTLTGVQTTVAAVQTTLTGVQATVAAVQANLSAVQTDVAGIHANYATRADLAKLEASMIKWFIGTSIAACGLSSSIGFALAKLVH